MNSATPSVRGGTTPEGMTPRRHGPRSQDRGTYEITLGGLSTVTDRIRIDDENPWYWNYDGERTLLLGGTDTDSLFQWAGSGLAEHLDELVAVGGNYVRNTMSDRSSDDQGGDGKKAQSVYAFAEIEPGTYDLATWNPEYWNRLDVFLEATYERDIVVELTLWDQHDFGGDRWERHPWNPERNVNYSVEDSQLTGRADFFAAVREGNDLVTSFQTSFVDNVLSRSLEYPHVIYNVSNEGWCGNAWERFWADRIHRSANERGVSAYVANMTMSPRHSVDKVLRNPGHFDYVEISQHNQITRGKEGQAHWDDILHWKHAVSETIGPRPFNSVKIYGAEGGHVHAGTAEEAVDRLFRLVLSGCATGRFHRLVGDNNWGIGLNERAATTIKSLRALETEVDLTRCLPRNDLLIEREPNESYCASIGEDTYVIYFPAGGRALLDLYELEGSWSTSWLDVSTAEWIDGGNGERVSNNRTGGTATPIELSSPTGGPCVALLDISEQH